MCINTRCILRNRDSPYIFAKIWIIANAHDTVRMLCSSLSVMIGIDIKQ